MEVGLEGEIINATHSFSKHLNKELNVRRSIKSKNASKLNAAMLTFLHCFTFILKDIMKENELQYIQFENIML